MSKPASKPASKSKKSYGQFCPVARAAEIFAERWTPLVLRELMCGSHRFSDLARGVPLMSPSLLSQRLRELTDAGIIERRSVTAGRGYEYHLTRAGEALRPVVEGLGLWGYQYLRNDLSKAELDPAYLMWDVRRCLDVSAFDPAARIVVRFDLGGAPAKKRRWWLVVFGGAVDLCLKPPGHEVDLHVAAPLRTLVDVWLGTVDLRQAIRAGEIALEGPRKLVRSFPSWFGPSLFAKLANAQGIERVEPAA